jgi:protein-histidine pros-kinase
VDLAKLTHDLRAPLNGVLGFGKLLHDGKAGALSEHQREFAADILESGQALLRVVRQLEEEGRGS